MKIRNLWYIIALVSVNIHLYAQSWQVPEDKKGKSSPFKFSKETIKKGETLFLKNCQSCHGLPGRNNFANIKPPPGDPATDKFQKQLDGELFFKITTGKSPMPEFSNILTEEDRWNVISFFRSFNKNYIQPSPQVKDTNQGNNVSLTLSVMLGKHQVKVIAITRIKEQKLPAKGVDVLLFVKRYFGNMQIDETKTTDINGIAIFDFPSDLPGDKQGFVELIAKVNEGANVEESSTTVKLAIGKPTDIKSLLDTRGWWLVREKAPIWLILTYCLSVIIVWGFILYIFSQVLKIRKLKNEL